MGLELFAHDATTWSPLVKDRAAEGVGAGKGGGLLYSAKGAGNARGGKAAIVICALFKSEEKSVGSSLELTLAQKRRGLAPQARARRKLLSSLQKW